MNHLGSFAATLDSCKEGLGFVPTIKRLPGQLLLSPPSLYGYPSHAHLPSYPPRQSLTCSRVSVTRDSEGIYSGVSTVGTHSVLTVRPGYVQPQEVRSDAILEVRTSSCCSLSCLVRWTLEDTPVYEVRTNSSSIPVAVLDNMQGKAYYFCALALFTMVTRGQATAREDSYRLTDFLFNGYKKDVRPLSSDTGPTSVYIAFSLFSIVDIDEHDQRMKTNAMLKITWVDEYLSWDATSYSNINSILVKQSSVWLPDIVVGNTVTTQTYLGYDNLQVRIRSDGTVNWHPVEVFDTSCDIDVTYYPFDTQVCHIVFKSSLSYTSELRVLFNQSNPIDMDRFSPDGIWNVIDMSASEEESENVNITFNLQLKRRSTYFVLNIFVPIILLAMTSPMPFALPADSGERMSLSVTLLLAFTVYLTLIANAMPQSSLQVSLLMLYVIGMMGLNALSVLLCVLILRLYYRPSSKPLGKTTYKVVLYIRQLMSKAKAKNKSTKVEAKRHQHNKPIFTVEKYKNAVSETTGIAPYDDHSGPSEDASTSSKVCPITGQEAGETLSVFFFIFFLMCSFGIMIIFITIVVGGGARQVITTHLN